MAKHRSKQDRIRAKQRRLQITSQVTVSKKESANDLTSFFAYDPKLIIGDLKKTLFLVLFILLILLGLALIYT